MRPPIYEMHEECSSGVEILRFNRANACTLIHTFTLTLTGKRVVVCDLSSHPEYNGQTGVARSFDASTQRYGVRLDGSGVGVRVRAGNLREWAMTRLELHECADPPSPVPCADLNELSASLPERFVGYNEDRGVDGRVVTIYVDLETRQFSLFRPSGVARGQRLLGCLPDCVNDGMGGFPPCGAPACAVCVHRQARVDAIVDCEQTRMVNESYASLGLPLDPLPAVPPPV